MGIAALEPSYALRFPVRTGAGQKLYFTDIIRLRGSP
jgi:hypothetical protein